MSNANETLGTLIARREKLEGEASEQLGRFLFAFSRLEHAVFLVMASLERSGELQVSRHPFLAGRLEALCTYVKNRSTLCAEDGAAYLEWIARASALRTSRNELIHGRWIVEPQRNAVLNVVEAEGGQAHTTEHSIESLKVLVQRPAELHRELTALLVRAPI
jgi:hypothetical protein